MRVRVRVKEKNVKTMNGDSTVRSRVYSSKYLTGMVKHNRLIDCAMRLLYWKSIYFSNTYQARSFRVHRSYHKPRVYLV